MVQDFVVRISPKAVLATAILLVLFVLFVGVGASNGLVLNFADPPASSIPNPGHSSADIVVNVSGSGACNGNISFQQAIDNGCLFAVGKCSADEVLMGDGSCENFNNAVGETVTNIFSTSMNLTCNIEPAITTVGDNIYHAYDVPDECKNGNQCVLKIEYYLLGSLWQTRTIEYLQYNDNRWTSSIYLGGTTYINGDALWNWVDYGYGGTWWLDDHTPTEKNAGQWSIFTGTNWSTKFFVCSYN